MQHRDNSFTYFWRLYQNYLQYEKYYDISPVLVDSWIDSKTRTNQSSSPRRSNSILRRRGRKKRTRSGNLAARLDGGRKRRRRNGGHRPSGNGTATKSDNLRNARSRHGEAEVGQGHKGEEGPGAGSKRIGGTEEVDIAYICLFRFFFKRFLLSKNWPSGLGLQKLGWMKQNNINEVCFQQIRLGGVASRLVACRLLNICISIHVCGKNFNCQSTFKEHMCFKNLELL